MKFNPWPYQVAGIQQIICHESAGLFMDMGLGKTVVTLTAIWRLRWDWHKVLVIAPLRVAELTWQQEAAKWDHLRQLRFSLVLGSQKERLAALDRDADIYVLNRENVSWLVEQCGRRWPFDLVVIDELSNFKSPDAKRFRALKRVRPLIKRLVGLTGTPAPNGYQDLWAQVYLLDQGERLGKTVTGFRQTYFYPGASNGHVVYEYKLRPGAKEAIDRKLADLCLSLSAKDWLAMPDLVENDVVVELGPDEREAYKRLLAQSVLELDGQAIVGQTAAALNIKLRQLANGRVYDDDGQVVDIHGKKLQALAEIREGTADNLLVLYAFAHDREAILAAFPEARVADRAAIEDWLAGKVSMLVAHPASLGYGVNLQGGGHTLVFYGLDWSLELYQQTVARLWRQGQESPSVICHRLVAKDTVDEDIVRALRDKDATQESFLEAIRRRSAVWQQTQM